MRGQEGEVVVGEGEGKGKWKGVWGGEGDGEDGGFVVVKSRGCRFFGVGVRLNCLFCVV